MTDGVFIAGCAQGPRDIPETVAQGAATAARVLSIIDKGVVTIEASTAQVNEAACIGCAKCITACPFGAIEYLAAPQKAHVIEALCKGCGTCSAACPSKTISLRHFNDKQLLAEMFGAMDAMYELA